MDSKQFREVLDVQWYFCHIRHAALILTTVVATFCYSQNEQALQKLEQRSAKGKDRQVIARCDAMIKQYPTSSRLYAIRGRAYLNRGLMEYALDDAEKVIELNGKDALGWQLKGEALIAAGKGDSAIAALQMGLLKKKSTEGYYHLGRAFNRNGQPTEAINAFNACLSLDSTYYRALRESGVSYSEIGDTATAHARFNEAISMESTDPVNWNSRGHHYWARNGFHERALIDYNKALRLNANYAFAYNNRGFSKWNTGNKKGALKDIRRSNQRRPNNPYVFRNLGLIKISDGRRDEACADFRQAIELGFTELYGTEVSLLIQEHCKRVVPMPGDLRKPDSKPEPKKAPVKRTPRTNAPGG